MDKPHEALLLRIFTSTSDRSGLEPLYLAIIEKARAMHLAGATVIHGREGFGHSATIHKGHLLPLTHQELPVVIEIVDSEAKINSFLPVLDEMMESGLVTLEAATVLQYGRERAGLLQRIKDYLHRNPHMA